MQVGRVLAPMRHVHVARPGLAAACLMLLGGCLKVPQESASLSAMDATEVTAGELQMRVYEAGRRISFIIEYTADSIAGRSADPDIRRVTLRWKLVAIPLVEEASLRTDPVVAVADLWALTMQMSDFVKSGDGRALFGEYQPLAIAASDTIEKIAVEVAGRLRPGGRPTAKDDRISGPGPSDTRSRARGWGARQSCPRIGESSPSPRPA